MTDDRRQRTDDAFRHFRSYFDAPGQGHNTEMLKLKPYAVRLVPIALTLNPIPYTFYQLNVEAKI